MTLPTAEAERFQAFERRVHDSIAGSYHEAFSPVTGRAIPPLLAAAAVTPGLRVLDVATGSGIVAAAAHRQGARAIGVDLSPGMVETARRLHPEVAFEVAAAEALPFPDGSFDVVLSSFGLGHFAAPDRALAECARLLVPGGRLALSWWGEAAESRITGLFFDSVGALAIPAPDTLPPGPSAFHFSQEARLEGALAGAGLADIGIGHHQAHHRLRDVDALWDLARASFARLGTIISALSPEDEARLRAELARRAAEYAVDGGLDIPIAFKIAVATRPA